MPSLLEHGKASTYSHHGCRCPECTEAQRVAMRSHRDRNPDYRERQRLVKQAYNRATKTLRARHAEEFEWLCTVERGEAAAVLISESTPSLEQMLGEVALMRVDSPPPYLRAGDS